LAAEVETQRAASIDFVRDVRPILAQRCWSCHGPEKQESDFRLDLREAALRGGAAGAAIVPGDGSASPFIERISSDDADLRMPPEGERLTADQVATLRNWIDQGAAWPDRAADASRVASDHWSLRPLTRPEVPQITDRATQLLVNHPVDALIRARLEEATLDPSAPADRRTLIRRVTFDLIGLPPTPSEIEAFVADPAPDAYEKLVDRLLASPRYGERWARHWMDVAHFAETHGNDEDRPRPNAWHYRDYLIRAFNEDRPYGQFIAEQIAGDALDPDNPQAIVALGFLAAGPWDESSQMGILDDTVDKKIAQVLDRDDMLSTVMSTICGATVHCARCHNHKFDPISQADYYSLQAVFAGVDRAERTFDPDPAVHRRRRELVDEQQQVAALNLERMTAEPEWVQEVAALEREFGGIEADWQVLMPLEVSAEKGSEHAIQSDGSVLFGGLRPERDTYTLTFETEPGATAIQLELLCDPSLPHIGPGRQDNGNLHLSEIRLTATASGGEPQAVPWSSASADFNQDGWGVAQAIDGKPATAWGIYPQVGTPHSALFVLREPLTLDGGATGRVRLQVILEQVHGAGHLIGRPRISITKAPSPRVAAHVPAPIAAALATPPAQRRPEQQLELAKYLLAWRIERELAKLPAPQKVYAATSDFPVDGNFKPSRGPRAVHLLARGDIQQPQAEATPGALMCLTGLEGRFALSDPQNEAARRAALAHWLTAPENVLTWRTIVNRVWHYHFGRGICDTPNDLGVMGGVPSHPGLLDWLAVEFRDTGGSLKRLHRLLLTSATYQQSSAHRKEPAQIDADNRLLWRMNRIRLDAESIRDAVLSISGKLDLTMGGPSIKQFVESPGIHVTPIVDYQSYDVDDPGNYRRSIYRFLFRTLPDPFMESMDCPDASLLAPVRAQSVTALQALSMLNNRLLVRQCEHTAERLKTQSDQPREQLDGLFQLALGRAATEEELGRWVPYAQRHGLASACRVLFNSNEFLFVN